MELTDRDIPSSPTSPCIDGIETSVISFSDTVRRATSANCALFAHKNTPTLSTWAVAKKSFTGENAMLVAILGVRNASIKPPVGMSNVRITESRDVDTIQRESGENAWGLLVSSIVKQLVEPYNVKNSSLVTRQLSDYPSCFDINNTHCRIFTDDSQESRISMEDHRMGR
jgi:hypothetical protein